MPSLAAPSAFCQHTEWQFPGAVLFLLECNRSRSEPIAKSPEAGHTMQCFKFIKVMMFLFNLLIFVSMVVVGFLGFLTKAGHSLNRGQAGEWETRYPDSAL